MYILRIVSANRQLSEAEFHQLFDNAKFKYTGGGLGLTGGPVYSHDDEE